MSGRVAFKRLRHNPYAECSNCDFYVGDGDGRSVRRDARAHVRTAGHVVYVTVEDVTTYEPGASGTDAGAE